MMKNNKGKKGILVTELQGIPSVLPKKHYVVLITQYFIFTLYFIIMSLWQGRGSIKVYWTKVQIIRDREERKFLKNINHQRGRKPGRLSWSLFIAVAVVQSLSCVRFFATPWIAAHQAPLSSTISWSLLKFMSIESVMLSNHLICH